MITADSNSRLNHRRHMLILILLIFAIGLILRFAFLGLRYTDDLRYFETGDYILYEIGAQHILEHGDFSNSLFLPRPPLYPLVVAAIGVERVRVLLATIPKIINAARMPWRCGACRCWQASASC